MRWALFCGCEPDGVAEFLAKVGMRNAYEACVAALAREKPLAAADAGYSAEGVGRARDAGRRGEADDPEASAESEAGDARAPSPMPAWPTSEDAEAASAPLAGAVSVNLSLTGKVARRLDRLTRRGRRRMLVYAGFFDGDCYVVRSVWRPTEEEWHAAKARGRKR